MFAKFVQLFAPRVYFYDDADTQKTIPPRLSQATQEKRVERWIIAGWLLIIAKCAGIWWLIAKYHVPIHPLWLIVPTVLFGMLATAVYIWRD